MILLLDTATPICRLTLVEGDTRQDYEWEAGRQLAKGLLEYLHQKLVEQGANFDSITGIGVLEGPGSFTGLRIGLTVMNTLASSLEVPIVGVRGDTWVEQAQQRLANHEDDRLVMPHYGAPANVTTPKK